MIGNPAAGRAARHRFLLPSPPGRRAGDEGNPSVDRADAFLWISLEPVVDHAQARTTALEIYNAVKAA